MMCPVGRLVGRTIAGIEYEYGEKLVILLDDGTRLEARERMTGGQLQVKIDGVETEME